MGPISVYSIYTILKVSNRYYKQIFYAVHWAARSLSPGPTYNPAVFQTNIRSSQPKRSMPIRHFSRKGDISSCSVLLCETRFKGRL